MLCRARSSRGATCASGGEIGWLAATVQFRWSKIKLGTAMTDTTAGGECTRRSLNEVLAAELECLRPDHKLYDSTANPPIRPACFKADEAIRAADLKRIYKAIGDWSATRRRDAADND